MIYFDNAATTYPKPQRVYREALRAMTVYGGNAGRSSHRLSREASRIIYECREEIAELFDGNPENVVFTMNATYALNIAINALYKIDGNALISSFEHNAVLRPINIKGGYDTYSAEGPNDFKRKISKNTSVVVCNQLSNLCGAQMPVSDIGKCSSEFHVPFIIDASQSAGRVPLSIRESQADAICAPGHKGLYGIQGCGFVLFSDKYSELASTLNTFVAGGNGVNSLEVEMPDFLPERFEAGTLSTPAIASLREGVRFVKDVGISNIAEKEEELGRYFIEGLSVIKDVEVYGAKYGGGTVLFNKNGVSPDILCDILDKVGFCLRGGYHCCPLGHKALKTPSGGAVRASFSIFNSTKEIDRLLNCLNKQIRPQ